VKRRKQCGALVAVKISGDLAGLEATAQTLVDEGVGRTSRIVPRQLANVDGLNIPIFVLVVREKAPTV
jgi:hypothetical protein